LATQPHSSVLRLRAATGYSRSVKQLRRRLHKCAFAVLVWPANSGKVDGQPGPRPHPGSWVTDNDAKRYVCYQHATALHLRVIPAKYKGVSVLEGYR